MKSQRTALEINGISLNIPDSTSSDSSTAKLHNMRYNSGGWHNIYKNKICTSIKESNGYSIIYKHPSLPENQFIAIKEKVVYRVEVNNGVVKSIQTLKPIPNNYCVKVEHFGHVLYLTFSDALDSSKYYENALILSEGNYFHFDNFSIPPISSIITKTQFYSPVEGERVNGAPKVMQVNLESFEVSSVEYFHEEITTKIKNNEYLTGFIAIIVAYKLFDGSIIKNSNVIPILSEEILSENNFKHKLLRRTSLKLDVIEYFMSITGCKAEIEITIPEEVKNNPFIKSIAIFSTRETPIYDFKILERRALTDCGEIVDIPEYDVVAVNRNYIYSDAVKNPIDTPFYLIDEIEKESFVNNKYVFKINRTKHLSKIEFKPIYEPNYSIHSTTSRGKLDYNNRLHRFGIRNELFEGFDLFAEEIGAMCKTIKPDLILDACIVTAIKNDNEIKHVVHNFKLKTYKLLDGTQVLAYPNLINYPDARATEIKLFLVNPAYPGKGHLIKTFKLKSCLSNNYAYWYDVNQNKFMGMCYTPVNFNQLIASTPIDTIEKINNIIEFENKIIASNFGNPFSYDPKHTYIIESDSSSRIEAIDCALDQLAEARYGDYPLIVFSEGGIFAMQHGSGELLYSNIVPLGRDSILPNSATVGCGSLLVFTTQEGIMAINGRQVIDLSKSLNSSMGMVNIAVPFIEYITGASLYYISHYKELMVHNRGYDYAYIYTMETDTWSTRDFKGIKIGHRYVADGNNILDLGVIENQNEPLKPMIVTRAIKLNSPEFKRIVRLKGNVTTEGSVIYHFNLYGSSDFDRWHLIASNNNAYINRTLSSWRYFKIELVTEAMVAQGELPAHLSISHFIVEYFLRFVKHLR